MNERDGCIYAGGNYIDKICVNKDGIRNGVEFVFNRMNLYADGWSFSDKRSTKQ